MGLYKRSNNVDHNYKLAYSYITKQGLTKYYIIIPLEETYALIIRQQL